MRKAIFPGAVLAALVAFGLGGGEFSAFVISLGFIYVVAAAGLHLLVNDAGELSLAHGMFLAICAFATTHVVRWLGPDAFVLGVLASIALGGAISALVALPLLRMAGLAAAVTTYLFAIAGDAYLLRQEWFVVETGSLALPGASVVGVDLATPEAQLLTTAIGAALAALAVVGVRRSRFGRALLAVRTNPSMAAAAGIDVRAARIGAYVVAGAFAGLAGALWALVLGGAAVTSFPPTLSLVFLTVVVIGGRGSLWGAAIAAFAIATGHELFGGFGKAITYISPIALILTLVEFNGGINEQARRYWRRIRRHTRRGATGADVEVALPAAEPPPAAVPARAAGEPSAGPVLSARDVSVTFGGVNAVDGVDLVVERGDLVGLIGPNGAGKSTLLNVIAGRQSRHAGTVSLLGADVTRRPAFRRARLGLRRTFQHAGLVVDETPLTNVLVALHASDGSHAPAVLLRRAHACLDEVGVPRELRETPVSELSSGVARLVEIACALCCDAPVLLLDEPTTGLTPGESDRLAELLRRRHAAGTLTAVVVAHDLRFVMGLVERVVVLSDGRVIAEGSPDAVQHDAQVRELYLGRAAVA